MVAGGVVGGTVGCVGASVVVGIGRFLLVGVTEAA